MQQTIDIPKVEFITTPKGTPKSVVLDIKDWKRIVETLKIISSKELMLSLTRAKNQLRDGIKPLSLKETFNL
ncbi:MAG: hypothetical protein AUJ85_00565 [Elusimicrobia bacterium CG1_02_37_114]|nr:MAG: hypothetical protein AUJ85_00565 [Elusimicrobia bacterium CG1_02_37_114]PIV52464.1 MAG: hypothetical protein COS17_09000 [Elusimicrobia bacterium CG02_land_8_20_14_3_00_37_13]PIZ14338.1 MAG: hypothetical protein COY53_00495 [Elusimicrobia bacterium CG_4_10_14_0_8_um_filter_37_32]